MAKQCRLLALPAELKNEIYCYSLHAPDDIEIHSVGDLPRERGLLRACRETRTDAINIYYQENSFVFFVQDFNANHHITFFKSSPHRRHRNPALVLASYSAGSWPNLLQWLRAFWHKECKGLSKPFDDDPPAIKAACYVFNVVRKMRDDGMGKRWEDVEFVLGNVRAALEVSGARWL